MTQKTECGVAVLVARLRIEEHGMVEKFKSHEYGGGSWPFRLRIDSSQVVFACSDCHVAMELPSAELIN